MSPLLPPADTSFSSSSSATAADPHHNDRLAGLRMIAGPGAPPTNSSLLAGAWQYFLEIADVLMNEESKKEDGAEDFFMPMKVFFPLFLDPPPQTYSFSPLPPPLFFIKYYYALCILKLPLLSYFYQGNLRNNDVLPANSPC